MRSGHEGEGAHGASPARMRTVARRYWQRPRLRAHGPRAGPDASPWSRASSAVGDFFHSLPSGSGLPRHGWRQRHLGITLFLWALVVGLGALAMYGAGHTVLGHAFRAEPPSHLALELGALLLIALGATLPWFSRRAKAVCAAMGIAAASVFFVHISRGLIEAHFLFLVGLALISLYHDWLPLVLSILVTVVHHAGVSMIDPTSVYNHPAALAQPVHWAFVHGAFVTGLAAAEVFHWRAMARARAYTDDVVGAAEEGLIGLDPDGYITFVNPAATRFFGPRERLVGQPASRVLSNRLFGLLAFDDDAFRTLSEGSTRSGRGSRVVDAAGEPRYVDWTQVPLYGDDAVQGAVISVRDVTERHMAETQLREQELQLSAAQRIAHVGSFEWAPVADVLRISEEFVRVIDNARVERPARISRLGDLLECVHPGDRESVHAALLRAHTHGAGFEVDCRFGDGDELRYCELRGQLDERSWGGAPQRLVRGTCNDITERVLAERMERQALAKDREILMLREQDEFKNRFINAVAHELNTPLTPVRLQLHLMRMERAGSLTPRQRRALDMLDRNIRRFGGLVEDLLDAARLQGGRLRMRNDAVELALVTEEALDHFEGVMLEKDLTLDTDIEEGVLVTGDRDRLLQVALNLVSNACKFTPLGGRIEIGVRTVGDEVVVKVRDTGVGVAEDDQLRLFQPFTQVQDHMETTEAGTGLGLYLCKGIVELHSGRIFCESGGPGKGATFGFALPTAGKKVETVTPRTAGAAVTPPADVMRP